MFTSSEGASELSTSKIATVHLGDSTEAILLSRFCCFSVTASSYTW
jgi:hypothetical protein